MVHTRLPAVATAPSSIATVIVLLAGLILFGMNPNPVRADVLPIGLNANLIANPGAEHGVALSDGYIQLDDWTITNGPPGLDGLVGVPWGQPGGFPLLTDAGPQPNATRGTYLFAGGADNYLSSARQLLTASTPEVRGAIDIGTVAFDLSGWLGGFSAPEFGQDDNAVLSVSFLNDADEVLDTTQIGPVLNADRGGFTGLLYRQTTGLVPASTRRISVDLQMTRLAGIYNDGYADNVSLVLTTVPPAPFNIFRWEYVNPSDPSQGKLQSSTLTPGGYGLHAAPGLNASFKNLTKAYLAGANLTDAIFSYANLTNAELSQANFTNADFSAAVLTDANFNGVEVRGANFSGSNFSAAQLVATASYQAHDLTGIQLSGMNFPRANLSGQNLSNSNLQFASLSRSNLSQANLTGANLTSAKLNGVNLTGAIFTNAVVRSVDFSSTQITLDQLYSTASYSAHDLAGIRFIGDDLSGADFSHQALASASFYAANLSDADLSYADVSNGEFVNADVSGANLTGANFTYATFALSDLSNSTLTGANFSGANLIGTNFKGADIRGAILGKIVSAGGGSDGRPCGCGIIWWPLPLPNPTHYEIGSGITLLQLASTASYAAKDLSGATFLNNNFNGGNFAGFNLTNSNFYGTTLTNANFSSADARGSSNLNVLAAANFIRPDGHIAGLNLAAGQSLTIRDYDGTPSATLIPIQVDTQLTMAPGATLRFIFDADDLNSTISFTAGIPVVLSGSLQLLLAEGVDPFSQIGRSFRIFNWDGVSPTGTFAFSSPYDWDFANLYTTGEIDFLGVASFGGGAVQLPVVPEPLTWQLLCVGIAAAWVFRRARFKVMVIIPVALLAFPGGLAFAARPDIHLTQIGNPIWKPVDFLLFSAPATPFAQQAAQIFDTILPNDDFNAYIPHSGPYDSELSTGALAGGYVTKSLFTPQAISLNPNGVYFIYMLVPQPGVTGDSRDFESGPVIPNALFPILNNVDVWLDGVLVDRTPGADAVINVAQLDVDNVGISHLEVMQAIWHPWDDDLAIGPLGRYDLRVSIRDASGSGWNAVVPFRVALPGDYDYSGTVGTEDYAVWKANFGSTTNLDADGNDDHIVDAADYTTWRDNLEATFASGPAGGNAAPEPSTLLLVTMLLAVILPSKRRRPRHAWIPQSKSSRHSPSAVTLPRVDATLRTWR
jgi:uncharacterized protein YjbI with pentapeptide repeats